MNHFLNHIFTYFFFFILAVLLHGALPLSILETVIDEFIITEKAHT